MQLMEVVGIVRTSKDWTEFRTDERQDDGK